MKEYEFEGKTTEEAIETASRELNIPVEELNVDIVEPGSAGIFGLVGGRKARIRVTLRDAEEDETETKTEDEEEAFPFPVAEEAEIDENKVSLSKETLQSILGLIPIEAEVEASQVNGKIALNITGDKSGLLIGRKGKTLDALQYLVNKIINKDMGKRVSIVVDSENYRERRRESLVQMAFKMGEKAKRIRKPVSTNLLNPHDRRIVHLALKQDEELDTRSRGEGLLKKVVIIPKR